MTEKQAAAFTREICRIYFEERNYDKLMKYISKDIVWVGVREKKAFIHLKILKSISGAEKRSITEASMWTIRNAA
ncbi:MAG: hypothetical protein LUK37_17075 [Clostridia bacterium]|nr:hypothetical protein [Clostridia bacterium]